jgi:hypothetical protein
MKNSDILELIGIQELPVEEQEELLLDLGDIVFRGTMLRLIERMDDSTQEDFSKLMDTDPQEDEVMAFLKERVPESDQAVEETLADLRSDILAVTSN